jgi:uncharacterized protein (DUF305 family)
MANHFQRSLKVSAVMAAGFIALAGCTANLAETNSTETSGSANHGMMGNHSNHQNNAESLGNNSGFSGADIMFAQMMIPHHQQAVLMSNLAIKTSTNNDVLALAQEIKAAQQPEITQMKGWITKAGASLDMGHQMGMGGMLTDDEIATLTAAKGSEFDRLFLQGMIAHHQGAIHMAQMVIDSNNAEAAKLGKDIIDSQTKQITYMQKLLAK